MPADRAVLGAFLRSRRDGLTPAQAGIEPFPGPRWVPGLRREELAVLAGLSSDHYSRIEQGRQPTISEAVVEALSRALNLDGVEREHLRNLAIPARRAPRDDSASKQADPGLLRMMDNLDVPVYWAAVAWSWPATRSSPPCSVRRWSLVLPFGVGFSSTRSPASAS